MPNKFNYQPRYNRDEGGALPILILLAALGLLGFLLISNTFEFRDNLFERLFPKPPSKAIVPITPNDPYYGPLQDNLQKINAPVAWGISIGNTQVVVAMLDTGVKADHEDLTGKILPGYNFYDNNNNTSEVTGFNVTVHGTSVAGVIGAATNNGKGIASLGWDTPILPLRVTDNFNFPQDNLMISAIRYAADHGAKVINISLVNFSANCAISMQDAINYAWSKGLVIVAGVGDHGIAYIQSPASCNNVLAVGGLSTDDSRTNFSNFGNELDIVAPGAGIKTTDFSGRYNEWSGNSFAAPHVSALAALLFAANDRLNNQQVVDIILSSAKDLGTPGWDEYYGCGRIDAGKALQMAFTPPSVPTCRSPSIPTPTPVVSPTLTPTTSTKTRTPTPTPLPTSGQATPTPVPTKTKN